MNMKSGRHARHKTQDGYALQRYVVYNWQDTTMKSQLRDALFLPPYFALHYLPPFAPLFPPHFPPSSFPRLSPYSPFLPVSCLFPPLVFATPDCEPFPLSSSR